MNWSIMLSIFEVELNYPFLSIIYGAKNKKYTRLIINISSANSICVVSILKISKSSYEGSTQQTYHQIKSTSLI